MLYHIFSFIFQLNYDSRSIEVDQSNGMSFWILSSFSSQLEFSSLVVVSNSYNSIILNIIMILSQNRSTRNLMYSQAKYISLNCFNAAIGPQIKKKTLI